MGIIGEKNLFHVQSVAVPKRSGQSVSARKLCFSSNSIFKNGL